VTVLSIYHTHGVTVPQASTATYYCTRKRVIVALEHTPRRLQISPPTPFSLVPGNFRRRWDQPQQTGKIQQAPSATVNVVQLTSIITTRPEVVTLARRENLGRYDSPVPALPCSSTVKTSTL
jgi:hypothetical protein